MVNISSIISEGNIKAALGIAIGLALYYAFLKTYLDKVI